MTIGEAIKMARKKRGLTQKELANKLNVSYVNISQIENGKRSPNYDTLTKIANALDMAVDLNADGEISFYEDDLGKKMGKMIEISRHYAKYTIRDLASKIGVSESTLLQYEKGERLPNYYILQKISDECGVDIFDELDTSPAILQRGLERHALNSQLFNKDYTAERNKLAHSHNLTLELYKKFEILNLLGKQKAYEYITDLSEQEKYTKPDEDPAE